MNHKSNISAEEIKKIIELSRWAPSGDNCQPFRFLWDGEHLHINHDDQSAKHSLNYKNIASFIAFGGLLKYIEIAAISLGYKTEEVKDSDSWIKIKFTKCKAKPFAAQSLTQRHTHRGIYSKSDEQTLKHLVNKAQKDVLFLNTPNIWQVAKLAYLETQFIDWKKAFFDMLKMVGFKEPEYVKKGMHWRNLGVNKLDSIFLQLLLKLPVFYYMFYPMLKLNYFLQMFVKINSGNGVVLFSFPNFEKESLIELGRTSIEFWLRATDLNLNMQPMTLSSLITSQVKNNFYSSKTPKGVVRSLSSTEPYFTVNDNANIGGYWMFRIGASTHSLAQNQKSKRWNVDDLLMLKEQSLSA